MPQRKPNSQLISPVVLPDDDDAFVRLPDVLGVFPVGETTWAEGVASGRYPKGFLLGKRIRAWRVRDIRQLLRDTATCDQDGRR